MESMGTIEVKGNVLHLDEDGFLLDPEAWDEDVAGCFAHAEGLELTSEHWEVVNCLREYFRLYQMAPQIKVLVKELGRKLGPDKGSIKYLYDLFPGGPAKQACRIAGLPRPTGCV
jgi:TusE/DsrC/DsvC family sulfur relay protein